MQPPDGQAHVTPGSSKLMELGDFRLGRRELGGSMLGRKESGGSRLRRRKHGN